MKRLILVFLGLFFSMSALASTTKHIPHEAIQAFIKEMVKTTDLKKDQLEAIFANVQYDPVVIQKISSPYESKPWEPYREFFVTQNRIEQGVAYWNAHKKVLAEAQKKYGVPASVIVAIIGVETNYGEIQGKFNELNALSTLAFTYPKRATFFKIELKEYLILATKYGLPVAEVKGSYAGALGIPQFMPSNYRVYGVSYEKNEKVDLMNNSRDAIFSIANFLKRHHWNNAGLIALSAEVDTSKNKNLKQVNGTKTIASFQKLGIEPIGEVSKNHQALFLVLDKPDMNKQWLVFNNFNVLKKYNTSNLYALVVSELSDAITKQYELAQREQHGTTS